MSESKQVKVDNWGIYFLQRLKNFFNRTDYCDLTLQFQDNAQLKVHRLVLSACTEYFELLERTCEMYEDCLVMPDDLQADVVVPIINFMYTGQLEFKHDLLEKLYQTSLIMNLPILTKLLDAHRPKKPRPAKPAFASSSSFYGKRYPKPSKPIPVASSSNKRTFSSAFENTDSQTDISNISANTIKRPSKEMFSKAECIVKNGNPSSYQFPVFDKNKRNKALREPRPTRYELPEGLDEENIFDNSFTAISYESKPLMIHPETATKQYSRKRINLFEESSCSSGFISAGTNDLVECRKISSNENIFLDPNPLGESMQEDTTFQSTSHMDSKDNSHLFDQILETSKHSKITIETKNNTQAQNLDHAKIISEVLKKYPHLVKSNKNIKLKILNTSTKNTSSSLTTKKSNSTIEDKSKPKHIMPDFTYESDVINSKEAAKLIALGVENIAGPWICLICGTPGKALHFTSYFNFRKHLVEVHNEKPVPSICEYCGVKSQKRNYIVHHKLTKHGVPAPAAFNFPKCNHCDYIALNEALLIKHKTSHVSDKAFKYNLPITQMTNFAQKIGKKYPNFNNQTGDKLNRMQCVYCMRVFLREQNLYAHLKVVHKEAARNDGLIDDSEEEQEEVKFSTNLKVASNEPSENTIKLEVPVTFENSYEDVNDQYQIEQKADGSICVSTKKPRVLLPSNKNKILNLGFSSSQQNIPAMAQPQKSEYIQNNSLKRNEYPQNSGHAISRPTSDPDTVIIDNDEYILQDNRLIPKKERMGTEYVVAHTSNDAEVQSILPATSLEFHNMHSNPERKMLIRKSTHINQPYQIVVSNEEEYTALMNSNQSVLYDDGEPNRGLSGIVEPDNSSLGTGQIDLDNTQSNDIMIIPDYHMNVPETGGADNSNIVVVYSHPVEDPNKQYSLITTQGHFVQSSAILTQNYQTVTTCTPVMNTHPEAESSWQNNIQATINKLPLPPVTELQPMAVSESITMQELQSNNMNELEEVQLSTSESVTIEVAQTDSCTNTYDESNIVTTISEPLGNTLTCPQNTVITLADPNVLANIQPPVQIQSLPSTNNQLSITAFAADTVNTIEEQSISEVGSNTQELEPAVEEILQQNVNDTPSTEIVSMNVPQNNVPCDSVIEESNSLVNDASILSENVDEHNVISSDSMVVTEACEEEDQLQETVIETNTEDNETIENIARDINESRNELVQCVVINQENEDVPPITVVKEHIANLTSEWSEEESEPPAEQSNVLNDSVHAQNDDAGALEAEESIENIQKEVNKLSGESTEADDAFPSDAASINPQNKKCSENVAAPLEKISSLLNDWDDNDSQEDNMPTNNVNDDNIQDTNIETQDENLSKDDTGANAHESTADKAEISKNIKSLVSDWDEDDEEENRE